jgi:predicted PurR-regulated permease PerM
LALTSVLVFFILRPFFYVLVFAGVFAVIFENLHKRILIFTQKKETLSALLTTIVIILSILLPLGIIAVQILNEISQVYVLLSNNGSQSELIPLVKNIFTKLQNLAPTLFNFSFNFDKIFSQIANWLFNNIGAIFSNMTGIATGLFIFIMGLFYFLKDGQKLKIAVIKFSPLSEKDDEIILDKLKLAINSVVKGSILVAIIQGIIAMIGLTIFDVPNPFLWGSMATISALIPAVGTSLIMIPSIIYLFLVNQIPQAVGLTIWFIFAVGMIDNLIGPKIVGKGIKMHSFIIFLSILGGLAYFGISGFLLGPLIISILFTLFDIYFSFDKDNKK